jgi:hypothetical protein
MIEDDQINNAYDQTNNIWKNEFKADIRTDHLFKTNDDS